MCLKPGTKVKIDGKDAEVVASTKNRIVAEGDNGIPLVRDVHLTPPDRKLSEVETD